MSPARVREAINAWMAGWVSVSGSVTLNAGIDPASSHYGKLVKADNSAGAVIITLPTAVSATCPDGFFCSIQGGSSNSFNISVAVAVSGQLRTQPGVTGWDSAVNTIFLGYKTGSTARTFVDVYKYESVMAHCRTDASPCW